MAIAFNHLGVVAAATLFSTCASRGRPESLDRVKWSCPLNHPRGDRRSAPRDLDQVCLLQSGARATGEVADRASAQPVQGVKGGQRPSRPLPQRAGATRHVAAERRAALAPLGCLGRLAKER
jgi:hypothetical protein